MVRNRKRGGLVAVALAWALIVLSACSFGDDGKTEGSLEGSLKVIAKLSHSGVMTVAWSPDGKLLASSGNGRYALWNPFTGELLHELTEGGMIDPVPGPVTFTPDGRHVLVYGLSGPPGGAIGFRLWNVQTGEIDKNVMFPLSLFRQYSQRLRGNPHFFFFEDGKKAAVAYDKLENEPLLIYDTTSWEVISRSVIIPFGLGWNYAMSQDGRRFATGGGVPGPFVGKDMGWVQVFDLHSGQLIRNMEGTNKDYSTALAMTSDGRYIATAPKENTPQYSLNPVTNERELMADEDPVRVWDVATGKKIRGLAYGSYGGRGLRFNPSGEILGAGIYDPSFGSAFRFWKWRNGTVVASLYTKLAQYIAFSPDGRHVAMAGVDKGFFGFYGVRIAEFVSR